MRTPPVALNSQGITGSVSPRATGRIRSGSTVVIVRRIRSAIRRPELDWSRLDTGLALVGCRRERPLPRTQSGNGVAARRVGGIDGQESTGPAGRAWATGGRPSARDDAAAAAVRNADRPRRMATADPGRRQHDRHRLRHLPDRQPASSTRPGPDTTDATGALV